MSQCILNVTDHEYDEILQMNHDRVVWNCNDRVLMKKLTRKFGQEVGNELRRYDECRMEKCDVPMYRVEPLPDFSPVCKLILTSGG